MDGNANQMPFDATPAAAGVTLACCQSLCDLLKELPLPSALSPQQPLAQHAFNPFAPNTTDLTLETALQMARHQLTDLVFIETTPTQTTTPTTSTQQLSSLALQLSLKGLFWSNGQQWPTQAESNSLETIEPSLRTQLDLRLIDELQNDCNEADVKYFEDSSYSSLGERVKNRQRQHHNSAATHTTPSPSETTPRRHTDDSNSASAHSVSSCQNDRLSAEKVSPKVPKAPKETSTHRKSSNHSSNHLIQNIDFQSKDSVVSFELIVNQVMSECVDDDSDDDDDDRHNSRRHDMSFDLRIDLKELNALMTLSSKLKHSNRMKDLETRLSAKLSSFLSLLTNKMIVWFSRFKETEESLEESERSDDNHFWQLLINASKMSLNVMTSSGMSSRVVLFEELLEIIINFLAHNLNSKTHVTNKTASPKKGSKGGSGAVMLTTSATKRQVTHWTELLEVLCEYCGQNASLNDSLVLMLTRIGMNALLLNAAELQQQSILLLSAIFAKYPKHRNSILEELLSSFARIPLRGRGTHTQPINVFTRLLIALTNALFNQTNQTKLTRESLQRQLTECLSIISAFLSSFCRKCLQATTSSSDSDLKTVFDSVLNDLLSALHFPQTSAALLLVQILTKLLINNLVQNSKQTSLQMRLNSIEFLSNISAKIAKLLSESERIREETEKTLKQLTTDSKKPTIYRILALLNQHFVCNGLHAEKAVLAALWIKETKISDMEEDFWALMNEKADKGQEEEALDTQTAHLFVQSLELNDFATIGRLFDASLSHVTSSLSLTTNTTQRSRAMKSLSQILVNCTLEKSTQLLARSDLQVAMRSALLDSSTSVREATVDLIGRFVLQSRSISLCEKYCDLIGDRILDTGVSVRKRVIKILREICIQFPEFEKCGEIQLKIIKRVNDEGEGIRKLVLEVVRDLWFKSLTSDTSPEVLSYKVRSLLHVIAVMLQTEGTVDSLQTLVEQIVKQDSLDSAQMIIDFVLSRTLTEPNRTLTSLAAIHLVAIFAQMAPQLLVKHCDSLQSLLSLSCDTLVDIHLRNKVVQSLEKVLPRVANPSPALMCRLEEDLTKQILQSSAHVLPNSVKCLAVLITCHTHNQKLCQDLFARFRQILAASLARDAHKPKLLRAIYSLGLFLKHFSKQFDSRDKESILETVLQLIEENIEAPNGLALAHSDLICRCITSLGFIVESDPKIALKPKVIKLYERLLCADAESSRDFSTQVLNNFRNYLSESIESDEMLNKSIEWSRESLKQMTSDECDSSSIQSQIIQTYLTLLLDRALSPSLTIRRVACNVIHVIQSGGHVHPLQLVPHLIAMTTDDDSTIRSRADHVLHEIERKFHGFVAMKVKAGIQLATQLCARLRCRGFRLLDDNSGDVASRLATLYHVICANRQSRRGFIQQLLRAFEINAVQLDDSQDNNDDRPLTTTTTSEMDVVGTTTETTALIVDNECDKTQLMFEMVLFFPFSVCDEVLYILQQLECIQSVNSTHLSQLFTQLFGFQSEEEMDEKFDENYQEFAREIQEERAIAVLCKRCLLKRVYWSLKRVYSVAFLRRLLKEFYLLKDEKILEYSPNEPKIWEKPIHRRHIETSHLAETLLRANPNPNLLAESVTIEECLEELKRFKSVALTSLDPKVPNQWIQQKILTIQKQNDKHETQKPITIESKREETPAVPNRSMDDLNDHERKRLLDSIRRTSCQVSLIDIGIPQEYTKRKTPSKRSHKRKRVRIDSDDSDDNPTTDDDTGDDSDDRLD